jgi:single-strand selective monofunctional uracil DNA glycosylase
MAIGLHQATETLRTRTRALSFGAMVAFVYYPLDYAAELVHAYEGRFGAGRKEVLFFGMNPGPFGMGQTGVPFGEVRFVRDWMKLRGEVRKPAVMHPKRPIEGLACTRSEVSGKRLWGAFADRYPNPDDFFARAFVLNYCPLLFLSETGSNITPNTLLKAEQRAIEEVCDDYVRAVVAVLQPRCLVGVGDYAKKRLQTVFGASLPISSIPHPSPASPAANRGWEPLARNALDAAGIDLLS